MANKNYNGKYNKGKPLSHGEVFKKDSVTRQSSSKEGNLSRSEAFAHNCHEGKGCGSAVPANPKFKNTGLDESKKND